MLIWDLYHIYHYFSNEVIIDCNIKFGVLWWLVDTIH